VPASLPAVDAPIHRQNLVGNPAITGHKVAEFHGPYRRIGVVLGIVSEPT
jgi:hypothetical protein